MSTNIHNAVFIPNNRDLAHPQSPLRMAELGNRISEMERIARLEMNRTQLFMALTDQKMTCPHLKKLFTADDDETFEKLCGFRKELAGAFELMHASPIADDIPELAWKILADIRSKYELTDSEVILIALLLRSIGHVCKTLSFFQAEGGVILKWYDLSTSTEKWLADKYRLCMDYQDAAEEDLISVDPELDSRIDELFDLAKKKAVELSAGEADQIFLVGKSIETMKVDDLIRIHFTGMAPYGEKDNMCSNMSFELRRRLWKFWEANVAMKPFELGKKNLKDFCAETIMEVRKQAWDEALGRKTVFRTASVSVPIFYYEDAGHPASAGEDDVMLFCEVFRSVFKDVEEQNGQPRQLNQSEEFQKFLVDANVSIIKKQMEKRMKGGPVIVVSNDYSEGMDAYVFDSREDAQKSVEADVQTVVKNLTEEGYKAKVYRHSDDNIEIGAEPVEDIFYQWHIFES